MSAEAGAVGCHVCGRAAVVLLPAYGELPRVTSDAKPWPSGGSLGVCGACGCIQTPPDERWQEEIARIYEDYAVYHQSGGVEQAVFDLETGEASSRSDRILGRLVDRIGLPDQGRMLDIGCGNGSTLRAFNRIAPGWSLAGTERSEKHRAAVESIPGVEGLYATDVEEVPGSFDLVSMIHVLEHIPAPRELLARIGRKLGSDGVLVVQVPDVEQNPFDLVVADHCTHFTLPTLTALVEGAGFGVLSAARDWVPKELTVVARPGGGRRRVEGAVSDAAEEGVRWLSALLEEARSLAAGERLGLFGSSIGATWLAGGLGDEVACFVDEDVSRIGRSHLGRPIYHPRDVPAGVHVLLALPPALAAQVYARLSETHPLGRWHLPPPLGRQGLTILP